MVSFEFKKNKMDNIGEKLKPISALIVFKDNENYYLEKKEVKKINNSYNLIGGKPMLKSDIQDIVQALNILGNGFYCGSLLVPNILYYNFKTLIFKIEKTKVRLNFNENIKLKSKEYYIPTLVFKLHYDTLYVYAVKTNNIKKDTDLYSAPFPNLHDNNKVCIGNVKLDKDGDINKIYRNIYWSFISSWFNNDLGFNIRYYNAYKKQNKSTKMFDNKVLMPLKLKLEDII